MKERAGMKKRDKYGKKEERKEERTRIFGKN
jgi:hypothetical protein